jgi:hypothetical protein
MAVTTKYLGSAALAFWIPTGGAAINLTGPSRSNEWDEKGSSIDVSTRDDKQAGAKAKLADAPDRTFSIEGLDTTPLASRLWRTIKVGDTGSFLEYPLGSGSGSPVEVAAGVITGRNFKTPFDNAATWKLDADLNTAWADTTVA